MFVLTVATGGEASSHKTADLHSILAKEVRNSKQHYSDRAVAIQSYSGRAVAIQSYSDRAVAIQSPLFSCTDLVYAPQSVCMTTLSQCESRRYSGGKFAPGLCIPWGRAAGAAAHWL